jgi:hypothetical protein
VNSIEGGLTDAQLYGTLDLDPGGGMTPVPPGPGLNFVKELILPLNIPFYSKYLRHFKPTSCPNLTEQQYCNPEEQQSMDKCKDKP